MKSIFPFVLLVVSLCSCQRSEKVADSEVEARAVAEVAVKKFTIPDPPQQGDEWVIPEEYKKFKASAEIEAVMKLMADLKLADPRGCEYRHVIFSKEQARAWVLPAKDKSAQQYAVSWNGMVYPVDSVGELADLDADIKILKNKGYFGEKNTANYQDESLDDVLGRFEGAPRMMQAWPARLLLLRLAHVDLFREKDLAEIDPSNNDPFADGLVLERDLYTCLVEFCFSVRADGVAFALDEMHEMASVRLAHFDLVFAELDRRFPCLPEPIEGEDGFYIDERPEMNIEWRSFLVDSGQKLIPVSLADRSAVGKLIDSWDQIEQWDGYSLPEDVAEVVLIGDEAIPALLDCIEKDNRWAGGVRNGNGRRSVFRVKDLAIMALEKVLQFKVKDFHYGYAPTSLKAYTDYAVVAHKFCDKYQNASGAELWYEILSDEDAVDGHALLAAQAIVTLRQDDLFYPDVFLTEYDYEKFHEPAVSVEGEKLRQCGSPSVLELMKKGWMKELVRVSKTRFDRKSLQGTIFPGSFPRSKGADAQLWLRYMEYWQPGNLKVLQQHYEWLVEPMMDELIEMDGVFVMSHAEEILIRRLWCEDKTAMKDYRTLLTNQLKESWLPLDVMKEFPELEGMDELATVVFVGKDAPLNFVDQPWEEYDARENCISCDCPLLKLPSYRKALLEGLRCADIQREYEKGKALRVCDIIAGLLAPGDNDEGWILPRFNLEDSEEKRDKVISLWIQLLEA